MKKKQCESVLAQTRQYVAPYAAANDAPGLLAMIDMARESALNPGLDDFPQRWKEAGILDDDPRYNELKKQIVDILLYSRHRGPLTLKRLEDKLKARRMELIGRNLASICTEISSENLLMVDV